MAAINRVKRSLFRAGELQECLTPTCSQGFEVPAVEVVGAVDGTQDGFDSVSEQSRDGLNAVGKRSPVELNPLSRLLTNADFQQHLEETLDGTSPRAQQVKQIESTYQAFWKDEQDFSAGNAEGPALTVPEPPRYEAPDTAVAEQPFSLLGRVELRA